MDTRPGSTPNLRHSARALILDADDRIPAVPVCPPAPRSADGRAERLVRTQTFTPRGEFSDDDIAAEGIDGWRWWSVDEIRDAASTDLFSPRPRALARMLPALLTDGPPAKPLAVGL